MKVRDNATRWIVALTMGLWLVSTAIAATPNELLDKAIELFQQGKYEQAQEVLLQVDREQLAQDRRQRRDELAEEVGVAVNQSVKASQNLEDASAALERKDLAAAEKLYQAVVANKYAGETLQRKAAEGLGLVKKQRELSAKLVEQVPTSRPSPAVTPPGGSTSRPAGDLKRAREARARMEAAAKIRAGEEATAEGKYDTAEQRFEEALKLVPNHPAAIHGLEIVKQHRSVEGKPNLIDEAAKRRLLRWTRTVRMFQENDREIRGLINERKYDEARRRLADTQQLIEAGKQDASPAEDYEVLRRRLDALDRVIDTEETDSREAKAIEQRQIVLEKERVRDRRVEKEKLERISELFNQAERLMREKDYDKAGEQLREALAIDPTYERAKYRLEAMEDAGLIHRQLKDREEFLNQVQKALLQADIAKTPKVVGDNDEIIAFPDEDRWRAIANRDPYGVDGVGGETEADRIAEKALSTPLPADLEFPQQTTFGQVIDRLKEAGRITINVNWSTLSLVGIDRETDVGELSIGGIKLQTALQIVLDAAGGAFGVTLAYDVLEGTIVVSTADDLNKKTETRVYDISDLLIIIRSISSESMGGGMMGGMGMMGMGMMGGMMGGMGGYGGGMMGGMGGYGGGMMGGYGGGMMGGGYGGGYGGGGYGGGYGGGGYGGGGYGQGGDTESERDEDRKERIDDLKDLIQKLVEPGTWEEEGGGNVGSLDVWNDRLIVRHTRSAHRQIRDLFKQLREAKDLQVAVEARFIVLSNNFLEQIGVDLDIVLNQGNAGFDQALSGTGNSAVQLINPATSSPLLIPRRNTELGFLPDVAAFGQPLTGGTIPNQPYGTPGLVPTGSPSNWWDRHSTAVPLLNNTLALAEPRATGVPGGFAGSQPGFSLFGSFLDNIQVDFLLKATQLDARASIVDAPRLTVYSGREATLNVTDTSAYVAAPGQLPVGGTGINGQAAFGRQPAIGQIMSGRIFSVTPTVSGDRKYVTLEMMPQFMKSGTDTFQDTTGTLQLPNTSMTSIGTTVTVPDRGWLLLGGLKQAGETEVEAGVPILSKIPILKRAYTNRSRVKDERTMLLLVKPTIIIQGEIEQEAFPNLAASVKPGG